MINENSHFRRPSLAWKYTCVCVLVLSGLGPTVVQSSNLRLEHVAIFLVSSILIVAHAQYIKRIRMAPVVFLTGILASSSLSYILIIGTRYDHDGVKEVVNFAKGPMLLLGCSLMFSSLTKYEIRKCVRLASICFLAVMALNLIAQVASVYIDATPFLRYFVSVGYGSVWMNSYSMGRFLGAVSQPATLGYMSGLGIIALVIIGNDKGWTPIVYALCAIVVISGILSGSKIAYVGIAVVSFIALRTRRPYWVAVVAACGYVYFYSSAFDHVKASNIESSIVQIREGGDVLAGLTGGRISYNGATPGTLTWVFATTWRENPLLGGGPGFLSGMGLPYDNEQLLVYSSSGFFGILSYCGFCIVLFIRMVRTKDERKKIFQALFVISLISSVGVPVLTGNNYLSYYYIVLAYVLSGNATYLPDGKGQSKWQTYASPVFAMKGAGGRGGSAVRTSIAPTKRIFGE